MLALDLMTSMKTLYSNGLRTKGGNGTTDPRVGAGDAKPPRHYLILPRQHLNIYVYFSLGHTVFNSCEIVHIHKTMTVRCMF